ncbi:MAG: dUTP diphosphatase [Calditrichaeota bacterium]|nr:dUTP diphosphatase [Calditrichota bacterium]RQW04485.1 MAG: dUTP diphosphatase [Calditrichota bacterium]
MRIRIYRRDRSIPLPERKTERSVGLDVYSAEDVELWPGKAVLVPTGLIIESPPGYYFKIFIRSGLAVKNGVSLVNDVGIVDEDYCGPEDEVKIGLVRHYNPADPNREQPLKISKGTRIAQIIFEKNMLPEIEWEEQEKSDFAGGSRGGFGSTGST